MKIKIVSDGTSIGTQIIDESTGKKIDNVSKIVINIDANKSTAEAILTFMQVPIDIKNVKVKE